MDERLAAITERLAEAIKDVVREFRVNEDEWFGAIRFLTEVGQRDEFILLSDVLGVSVLVDEITHEDADLGTTSSNTPGPFWRPDAPFRAIGAPLGRSDEPGEPLKVRGVVRDAASEKPIPDAVVDVWQTGTNGRYDHEDPEQPEWNLRGRIRTDGEGAYEFSSVVPRAYEIGAGSPVGRLLVAVGRHAMRPAHIHFKVAAPGYRPLTTMVYFSDTEYLDSDVIGSVRDLVLDLEPDGAGFRCTFEVALSGERAS